MLDPRNPPRFIARLARVAFTFMVMNWSAVAGLAAAVSGRNVWRG
jgi:hypothetical protein